MENGLIIVHTGNGKGKTTAALGLGFRAVGQGMKVLMLQFIKGSQRTGELHTVKRLEPDFQIVQMGKGFIKACNGIISEDIRENVRKSWESAKEAIFSDSYDMVILDEINNVIDYGLVDAEDVISVLKEKPKRLNLVLTGRNARNTLIEMADMVTDMQEIKHHYKNGVKAQRGIEF
ncbi:MAG: cob(I)yrinic acid a,c-diamide adenosyltransferase [Candidatus Brocadiaceae bacterium]|nr:cob(I)yrinic acid a,c-diamide adenosyltransferase [Candidatus Brocadiaceae bacterium]